MESNSPTRGEIWLVAFGASRPGEPGKHRPAVILSVDDLLSGSGRDLLVVIPLSSSAAPSSLRPVVTPDEGIDEVSVAICRAVRSVSRDRLIQPLGVVRRGTLEEIEHGLGLILGLR
jgi:mRNA interferase MazF